jgi:hypothetical protein
MSDEDFPLGCGPCHAPLAVQRSWVDAHSFGVLSEDYADPPQNITSCRIADRSISHRQRTFDFKIKTDSNSILDRIQHVEDVGELARVLSSTSCGCTLYAGGCPKAVKSFVGSDWDDRIRAERMKRYTGKPPTKVASDLTRQAIRENTVDGVFQPTFLGLPVCRDVWLYLSHTSQSNYQRIMREINLTPTKPQKTTNVAGFVPRSRAAFKTRQTEATRLQKKSCSYVPLKTTQMQHKQATSCASLR